MVNAGGGVWIEVIEWKRTMYGMDGGGDGWVDGRVDVWVTPGLIAASGIE
jgi:hypothetical protein